MYHNRDSVDSEQIAAAVQVEISSEQEEDSCYPVRSDVGADPRLACSWLGTSREIHPRSSRR